MEEELNEHELEERLYAMLHHVDETQKDVIVTTQNDNNVSQFVENCPRGTLRRYWRTGSDYNQHQKINTPKEAPVVTNNSTQNNTKPKEDEQSSKEHVDLTLLQSPIPRDLKPIIEIIEHEELNQVLLETSDEDEVVEVALPPKPTITIDSSDEDDIQIVKPASPIAQAKNKTSTDERGNSTSPVPSVVSSISDEFIRGDCIALNISSRQPQEKPSFDFSLHGSDLMQDTPTKKKKKKKSKEAATSTPINSQNNSIEKSGTDECFATPKSKAKNRKQKTKSFTIANKNVPVADIYDSDSNQSIISSNLNKSHYTVTETSLPSTDVYESDSNQSEITKEPQTELNKINIVDSSLLANSPIHITTIQNNTQEKSLSPFVDLTENDDYNFTAEIHESIVMGNVTGFTEPEDYSDENQPPSLNNDISKYISSKVPSILFEDLDFDNLKGKDRFCKRRRYSLKTLHVEMEKFYNESWGGEEFNHKEIQKNMSRDKSLWAIDPKDKMPSLAQRKQKCGYCGRMGHRDESCYSKPPICYMCGNMGHMEPRCPKKICFNCGTPNHNYTHICRNCASWGRIRCNECGQMGHPATHCPDLWRRYHNTIELNMPLERISQSRSNNSMYCSGCTRRGHLIHTCRTTIPFSGLPINSPYVFVYRPIYGPITQNKSINSTMPSPAPQRNDRNKRQSKSPTMHGTHVNKKRSISLSDSDTRFSKTPINTTKNPPQKDQEDNNQKTPKPTQIQMPPATTKAPEYIPISSSNRDDNGHIIQDNEVSDTSDVVTSARIYVSNDLIEKLKTKEGAEWLAATAKKLPITVETTNITSFLTIKGKVADQESFQIELREWSQKNSECENPKSDEKKVNDQIQLSNNMPKNRMSLLRFIDKALNSLNQDIGDPKAIYKELTFSQNRHQKLMRQKVINPRVLNHSRGHINEVLKKLNTLLLGQAGLADGPKRVKQLFSLKEKVANFFTKHIPINIRQEIDDHYKNVFGSIERNDYVDLLNKYYVRKPSHSLKNKKILFDTKYLYKKRIPSTENIHKHQDHNLNTPIQNVQNNGFKHQNNAKSKPINVTQNDKSQKSMQIEKLKEFHKQLLKAQPSVVSHKKARVELIRRLHTLIASLLGKDSVPSKMRKKVKKTQQDAYNLLTNM